MRDDPRERPSTRGRRLAEQTRAGELRERREQFLVDGNVSTMLEFMARMGSSVILNYGEDTGLWECSWITSGERYTTHHTVPLVAIGLCIDKVLGS